MIGAIAKGPVGALGLDPSADWTGASTVTFSVNVSTTSGDAGYIRAFAQSGGWADWTSGNLIDLNALGGNPETFTIDISALGSVNAIDRIGLQVKEDAASQVVTVEILDVTVD